jgi:hypothetical protein
MKMGNLLKFKVNVSEQDGVKLLEVAREIALKLNKLGDDLGAGFPVFLDEELYEIEQMAFSLLGLDGENETIFELYQSYILSELTTKEFLKRAKASQKLADKR